MPSAAWARSRRQWPKAAGAHGVRIDVNAAVREIIVERDRATGVVLDDGTPLRAGAVVANVDPQRLFQQLVPREAVPAAVAKRMKDWKAGSGTFRMNVALSKLPRFAALPDPGDHHTSGIILAPSLGYMDKAYRDCMAHGWSSAPIVEMVIPSTLDDSLAPPAAHVASLFCQHVAPKFADGSTWDRHRETVADLMVDTVEAYAPGFKSSIVARQSLSPFDLEQIFGLPNGDIFHGALTLKSVIYSSPHVGVRRLPHADPWTLSVRRGCSSWRRSDGRAGAQCGAGRHRRSPCEMRAVRDESRAR